MTWSRSSSYHMLLLRSIPSCKAPQISKLRISSICANRVWELQIYISADLESTQLSFLLSLRICTKSRMSNPGPQLSNQDTLQIYTKWALPLPEPTTTRLRGAPLGTLEPSSYYLQRRSTRSAVNSLPIRMVWHTTEMQHAASQDTWIESLTSQDCPTKPIGSGNVELVN